MICSAHPRICFFGFVTPAAFCLNCLQIIADQSGKTLPNSKGIADGIGTLVNFSVYTK
jgi:hypothetical protein